MRIYFEKFGKSAEMRIFLDILRVCANMSI